MWIAATPISVFPHMRAHGWCAQWEWILGVSRAMPGDGPAGSAGRGGEWAEGNGSWGVRHVGLCFQVHAYAQMRAFGIITSERCLRFVFAGLCASRVGAADPMRTDVAPLDGTTFTTGQGWRSASLVTVEDEAPALDTVVVDPQGALDINAQVASESESAGVFTATFVHVHCAHVRKHRDDQTAGKIRG
jgi:hypothetical protein